MNKRILRIGKGKVGKKTTTRGRKEKTTLIKGEEMVSVTIDRKTTIFVPKGTNKEKAKADFIEKWQQDQGTLSGSR
jgi:hypothetical protein